MTDKRSPNDCNTKSAGGGEACQDILDWFRSRREEREAGCQRDVVESNIDGSSTGGPQMHSNVPTQFTDVEAPIPTSQTSHAKEADPNHTKLKKPAPIQLPDDPNIPLPVAMMHLKDDIADETAKSSSITPVQMADEEDHPIPAHFMHSGAVIHKKDVAFENPPRLLETSARLDDDSLVPPSASIRAADELVPSRNMDDQIAVVPEQPQMQAEEENDESLNPREDPSNPVNSLPTEQETSTEHDFVIPEAFLVDEIPSAEIVPTEKYSITIAGRKIHIGFLALSVFILISVIAGVSVYATTASNKVIKLTEDATVGNKVIPSNDTTVAKNNAVARAEGIMNELERHVLPRYNGFHELRPLDVRNSALDWILYDDPMKLNASDSNLHQRYILALLGVQYELDWLSEVSEENECFWYGVSCHEDKVNEINLGMLDLRGTLPPEIGGLAFLERLDLSNNSLAGSLPSELGNLRNLTYLDLSLNSLTGSLPSEIGNVRNLTNVHLNYNDMTGRLPSEIGNLLNLTYLNLSLNSLSGSLPSEIGSLHSLTYLDLRSNSLTGSLPSEIGSLRNLTYIDLSYNSLTGSLPSEIGRLGKLTNLHLCSRYLTGSLPSEIGSLVKLTYLDLSGNCLTGSLPSEIGNLRKLDYLYLGWNCLTGSLPSEIGSLRNLTHLDLHGNLLTGSLPSEIGSLRNLTNLNLNYNNMTGRLPSEIGSLGKLTYLALEQNLLTGTLPSSIGNLVELDSLYLSRNALTGTIPTEIGLLTGLVDLYLNGNALNGTLPLELGDLILANLTSIDISDNKFTGVFPESIANATRMVEYGVSCFSDNSFTGNVPKDKGFCEEWF